MQDTQIESWIGRTQHADDVVALSTARRLAALLDRRGPPLAANEEIPAHWYQILFGPLDAQSLLAADGHPAKGDFLPPIALPRRMFAGRTVRFMRPLRPGQAVRRTSTIQSITPKTGRSGPMCFVAVRHVIHDGAGECLVDEQQDIVYRAAASAAAPNEAATGRPHDDLPTATLREDWLPDETQLFRYSAITFNAHRIHYDLEYTRKVEGYPGLVVNGGLTTMKLWDLAERGTRRRIAASRSRNLQPLFAGRAVALCLAPVDADNVLAWAVDDQGRVAVRAELELAETLA
jgi:3-methylfumaryl-CoA hydratase